MSIIPENFEKLDEGWDKIILKVHMSITICKMILLEICTMNYWMLHRVGKQWVVETGIKNKLPGQNRSRFLVTLFPNTSFAITDNLV